jgi:hypothetical protein
MHDRKKVDKFGRNKGKGKKFGISGKKLRSLREARQKVRRSAKVGKSG